MIYRAKGEKEEAIVHFETVLKIATPPNWREALFWIRYALATLLSDEGRFNDANPHIKLAKSHTVNDTHNLGRVTGMQAWIWYRQHRLEDARPEAFRALKIFEKFEATQDVLLCRGLLQNIEREMRSRAISADTGREFFLAITLFPIFINSVPS